MNETKVPYLLGVDLGVSSIGWAAVLTENHNPVGILAAGVRCFEAATGTESEIEQGKDKPPGQARRAARQHRRQLFRRQQRLRRVWHALQNAGLLPSAAVNPTARDAALKQLDRQLAARYLDPDDPRQAHLLPYVLRARALDEPLEPFALGRALYHLAQRRGFRGLRGTDDDEERGAVKQGIAQLLREMQQARARTLGEYFASLDPTQQRIRARWTSRDMYLDEFDRIWERQARDNAALTDRHKQAIHRAIFFQRPLKSQRGLVGRCSLERGRRRAPEACLEFQEFRYLQRVNDLEVRDVNGWRRLTAEERRRLTDALDVHEKLTFSQIRRLLGFRRPRGDRFLYEFNLEAGGESKLMGNQTAARLRSILGDRWDAMPPDRRKEFVDEIISFRDEQALVRRLQRAWDLDETMAGQVVDVPLPSNFASFSRKALRRLLPRLHAGERLQTAIKNEYGPRETHTVYDRLPPVREAMSELRNPVVCRALTELRRVVNAIVARYGKPQAIRVELARDLKMSRERRKQRWKQMRENERKRDAAKERIIRELGIQQPRNTHILKVILAEECNWECPYTGRTISMEALIGSHPQFDIEHIIPFSRSLDDSIVNKTLCYHEENRERKRGRTPWEAYGSDEQRWHEILSRVGRFQGPLAKRKFELFALTEVTDEFVNRQLSDTRYITRAAVEYLGLLYGGVIDESGKRRVQTTTGPVTSQMARAWGLGRILGPGSGKNRDDHRHHAVDAIVIALTDAAVIQRYSRASQQSESRLGRIQVELPEPWPDFVQSVQRAIDCIVVSHRAKRRLSGALHEETNYGIRNVLRPNGRVDQVVTVRKRLDQMSSEEVQRIIDPVVRQLVLEKLKAVTGRENADPKRVFAVPENLPHRTDRAGNVFPVRAARIQARRTVQPIGSPAKRRYVAPGSNSHMEIVAELDTQGRELRWEGHIVSRLEAYARYRAGEPVVKRDHGPNKRFLFSLRPTEMVEMNYQGQRNIFKVEAISSRQLEFVLHSDARPSSVRRKQSGQRVRLSPDRLRSARARKVVVDPLGKILPAND